MRAFILRRVGLIRHTQGAVVLVGSGHSADTLRLKQFLTRNGYPHQLLDTDTDEDAQGFLECFKLSHEQLPVVVLSGKVVLRRPSNSQVADGLGLTEELDASVVYDLAVVGAGPAGLAAAVYAASEGLATVVLEALAPGGQAGTSSKIENYLGFPTGISGQALAGRAQVQAQKFGARLAISRAVTALDCSSHPYRMKLEDGTSVRARAIVIASGARYRTLEVPNYARYEGQGIHYAATAMEAQLCQEQEVVIVGGGNSAGQAAVFLSRVGSHVYILVRGTGLGATMSDYLVQRIAASSHITLLTETEITALEGEPNLQHVAWQCRSTGETTRRPVGNVFAMLGAVPNTDWLTGCLKLDSKGFVLTGAALDEQAEHAGSSPYSTSVPGVYAVGDVRSGSVKRVASAVGEGSVVVQAIHQYLSAG
jgi:thioredoxin reductase (NADPH)